MKYKMIASKGSGIREAVQRLDAEKVMHKIEMCCIEITKKYPVIGKYSRIDVSADFNEYLVSIGGEYEICKNNDIEKIKELGFADFSDLINTRFLQFINLCQRYEIFFAI